MDVADLREGHGIGWFLHHLDFDLVVFVLDLGELCREVSDAFSAGVLRHGALFERGLVFADLAADRVDLVFQPGEVFAVVLLGFRGSGLVGGDGGVEDRRSAVGLDEGVEDGVLEGVRG
ncbi:hypothetical protein [Parafrankia discariae]|uniref:hypothetical protein n=1 Tax=Parafrankia discariae TaxID=365528 RepID=UPI0012B69DA3|nr:hypothetical protein [Parafrankia discariae]